MRLTIIIVSYNGRSDLERCLRSLTGERRRGCEVIVVDNASTDGSAALTEDAFPDVTVIRNQHNGGFAYAGNLGARRAIGDYLAFLNPDTVVEPGWLDEMIAALERDPRVALATPQILLLGDPDRVNTIGNDTHYTGLTLCHGVGMERSPSRRAAEVGAVSGAAFVIRRWLFNALGGFDESFFLYLEDTDLSWRARLAGYRCIAVPTSVVYHDYTLGFGPEKTFLQERNRYLMLLKCLRWRTLLVLTPALLLAELVTWGFVVLRERRHRANKLRAYAWVVQHWRQTMEARRRVQALRRVRDRDLLAKCTHCLAFEQTGAGWLARIAHAVFDPLFLLLYHIAVVLLRIAEAVECASPT